tara:strand:+ start:4148 stop:4795 length:648 start_codon:yes stop_codon:yes gene_type:complete
MDLGIMNILDEVKGLSPLRKNQQLVVFYMLFVNAMIIACTATFYVEFFGSDGLILKDYAISVLGLMLFIPVFGRFSTSKPLRTFKIALTLEFVSVVGYLMTSIGVAPQACLIVASYCVVQSGIIMRPINTQVDSLVTAGCADYSLLKSKLDALYTAVGAAVGASFLLLGASKVTVVIMLGISLACSRYYRKRVLVEIYEEKALDRPIDVSCTVKA